MQITLTHTIIFFFLTVLNLSIEAQELKIFQNSEVEYYNSDELFIKPIAYRTVSLNDEIFNQKASSIPKEEDVTVSNSSSTFSFPLPDGTEEEFRIVEYSMMESDLAAAFPNIKTYYGVAVKNPRRTVRFDYTSHGLRAVIRLEKQMVYIDPIDKNNSGNYISYYRKDLQNTEEHNCEISAGLTEEQLEYQDFNSNITKSNNCGLKRYRLAIAATSEYCAYYSATSSSDAALVLSAITTSINRVNEIYERDLGIRLQLISGLDVVFYYNAATDPYTNNDPSAMLSENQTNLTNVFGSSNFDVGHVVSTSNGGVASVNSPCSDDYKARGVTGLSIPEGDVFDIDFLAHELGHQFGAHHTFNNSCSNNVNRPTSIEPGSGSTIMGYAGTCAPNVQANSDAYFHAVSLAQINAFINGSSGSSCAVIVASGNSQPTADAGENFTIPASTPFYLEGFGTDVDGDALTYCWEQMDADSSAQSPVASSTVGPNFRSYLPDSDSIRYIPNLADLASGTSTTWEVLSSVTRDLNFRLTVRDNSTSAAGCYANADKIISVNSIAGPFLVSVPNLTGIVWTEGDRQTVTWDVANTDLSPINCSKVDVLLSYDGGLSYPVTLLENIDNDGSTTITVPSGTTTAGRLMIKSVGNIFFDVSDNDFTINAGSADFSLAIQNPEQKICSGDDAIYNVTVGSINSFSESILLSTSSAPAGTSVVFGTNPISPGATTTLTVTNTSSPSVGDYVLTLNGSSTVMGSSASPKSIDFNMDLSNKPASVIQVSPSNNATDIPLQATFTYNGAISAIGYEVQVSTDPSFATVDQTQLSTTTSATLNEELNSATDYFWRVRGTADCGGGDWSIPLRFTTLFCSTYVQDTLMAVNDGGDAFSDLWIDDYGTVNSIEVQNVTGSHTWVEDLTATLISPDNTSVVLWQNLCGSRNDFSLSLNDNAANILADVTCDPLGGGAEYQPVGALSDFNSESGGNWQLKLNDNFGGETGDLETWSLKVCISGYTPSAADPAADSAPLATEVLSFVANANGNKIGLEWETVRELDVAGFEIERKKKDAVDFQVIGQQTNPENITQTKTYTFDDYEIEKGITYQYRLRIINDSGDVKHSEIREAQLVTIATIVDIYPNPAKGSLHIDLNEEDESQMTEIEIFSISGKEILNFKLLEIKNTLDISSLTAGIYIVKVLGKVEAHQQKLVVD